jgi:predicted nucleic acid-binding protein
MAKRLVAADASPLIGLAAAGAFELLRGLFGRVTVTEVVRDEIQVGTDRPGARELAAAIRDGWVEVVPAPGGLEKLPELAPGEASTLLLAQEHGAECLVLMDEKLGRARARALELPVTGLAGVLLEARRSGLVEDLRPLFDRLARSDFRISPEMIRAVLDEAGD